MMLDKQLMFEDALALSGLAVATTVSTNTVDLWGSAAAAIPQGGTVPHDIGKGTKVELFGQVLTTATSGGAATLTVQLITSAAAALTSPTVIAQTMTALALATLVAGYRFRFGSVPVGILQRYLGVQFVVGTAVYTGGTISVGLAMDTQTAFYQ